MNNLPFIVIAIIIIIYIISSIRREKLSVSVSFAWVLVCIAMLVLACFPYSLDWVASLLGISYPPALLLTICVSALFIMSFIQDKKIDELEQKLTNTTEELNILRAKKNGKK